MYEQLFLMYVIPSVMVQSYICYVTKPVVSNSVTFPLLSTKDREACFKGCKGKGQCFDCVKYKSLALRQSVTEPRSFSTRRLETWKKTKKIINYSRGRTSPLQNFSSSPLTTKYYISNVLY